MTPVKTYWLDQYQIQTSRSDLNVVSPLVLGYARSKPEMIFEFLSIFEKVNHPFFFEEHRGYFSGGEICEVEREFNRRNEVQFQELYNEMKYAPGRVGFLVTTNKTGNNLVPFSVKRDQTADSVVEIIVPSIWDLQEQSDFMPPLLSDIVKGMENCSNNETFPGGSRFPDDQSSQYLAATRLLKLKKLHDAVVTSLLELKKATLRMFRLGDRFQQASNASLISSTTSDKAPYCPSHAVDITSLSPDQSKRIFFLLQNREVDKPRFNDARQSEAFLMIAAQTGLAALAIGSSGIASLSHRTSILFYFAISCIVTGFLCCLYNILVFVRKPGLAARITKGIGYIASVYGFLALTGMLMPENVMLEITGVLCAASFPALVYAFMR